MGQQTNSHHRLMKQRADESVLEEFDGHQHHRVQTRAMAEIRTVLCVARTCTITVLFLNNHFQSQETLGARSTYMSTNDSKGGCSIIAVQSYLAKRQSPSASICMLSSVPCLAT